MASLAFMAKPTNENKLTARTAPPVVDGVKLAVLEMSRRKIKYRGRNIGIEGLVGAVMLDFLDLSREEQADLLVRTIPRIEAMFAADSGAKENPADQDEVYQDLEIKVTKPAAKPKSRRQQSKKA